MHKIISPRWFINPTVKYMADHNLFSRKFAQLLLSWYQLIFSKIVTLNDKPYGLHLQNKSIRCENTNCRLSKYYFFRNFPENENYWPRKRIKIERRRDFIISLKIVISVARVFPSYLIGYFYSKHKRETILNSNKYGKMSHFWYLHCKF